MSAIHTPYDGAHKPFTIGLSPLDVTQWIEIDHNFAAYIAEKNRLYAEETANVLAAAPESTAAQQEVLELLVDHLSQKVRHPGEGRDPALLQTSASKIKLDHSLRWDDGLGQSAIAAAGLLVQEDLVIMQKRGDDWCLTAASLCFPSSWNLREKFQKPMQDIHGPVPGFGPGTRNASLINRMFDNLRVEQPVIRWNWSLYGDQRLYHPASDNQMKNRFGEGKIVGKVFMRLERQTLRKLLNTGAILFTIRIYIDPLEVLQTHSDRASLTAAMSDQLRAMSDDEIGYKGLVGERPRLLQRLAAIAAKIS
jgi:dimethylamine monooxygenase subunit A